MGKFRRQDQQHAQQELWVPAAAVVTGPQDGFYAKLNAVPAKMRFTGNIHLLCEPYYKTGASTVTGDGQAARRRLENLEPEMRAALQKASRAVRSQSGKDLLRQRGEKIERGFAHTLDSGGQRRTTLRGLTNINKRYLCGILAFNLCLIMRKLTGWGTPKQTAAAGAAARALLCGLWRALRADGEHHWPATEKSHSLPPPNALFLTEIVKTPFFAGIRISPRFSIGS